MSLAEKLFYQDVKQKKRIGSGSFHMKGKGKKNGIKGGMKTTYDYLSAKQKRNLNGAVKVSNIYTTLMDYEELKTHPKDRQKRIIEEWRKIHPTKDIMKALGLSSGQYYNMLYNLGILQRPKSKPKTTKKQQQQKRDATESDVIPYIEFKELSDQEKDKILEDYMQRFNLRSVADLWGHKLNNLYNIRYHIKKRLDAANDQETDPQPVKEKSIAIEAAATDPEEDHQDHPMQSVDHVDQVQEVKEIIQESIQEKDQETGANRMELEELKQLVFEQSKVLSELVESQKQQVHREKITPQKDQVDAAANNFSINYEDQKEGFLMYQDLNQLLMVLKKNPGSFKASITIEKINEGDDH